MIVVHIYSHGEKFSGHAYQSSKNRPFMCVCVCGGGGGVIQLSGENTDPGFNLYGLYTVHVGKVY